MRWRDNRNAECMVASSTATAFLAFPLFLGAGLMTKSRMSFSMNLDAIMKINLGILRGRARCLERKLPLVFSFCRIFRFLPPPGVSSASIEKKGGGRDRISVSKWERGNLSITTVQVVNLSSRVKSGPAQYNTASSIDTGYILTHSESWNSAVKLCTLTVP